MLEDTGERIIPDNMKPSNRMLLEHMARYTFSMPFVHGRVLDLACGSGYGAQLIAKDCRKMISAVIAADIDPEAIKYAKGRYFHPQVQYQTANVEDQDLVDQLGTFDTILSFETYEHIENEDIFLSNLYDLLKPGGTLILSTPFGQGRALSSSSPFHVHQITIEQFYKLFDSHPFINREYFFQRGVLIEPRREGVYYPLGLVVCTKAK